MNSPRSNTDEATPTIWQSVPQVNGDCVGRASRRSPKPLLSTDIAATFKNFDLSVQSAAPARSLLFASHRGDHRRADMRRWQ